MQICRNIFLCFFAIVLLIGLGGCKKNLPAPILDPGSLTILCLGDSITAGTHSQGDDGQLSYPGIMTKFLQEYRQSVQVINEGQNGWMVNDVAGHVAAWLQPTSPNIILLQIGTNDLEQGVSPDEAARRLDVLVTQIQLLAPKCHLYVASCTRLRVDNRPGLALAALEKFNNLVPKIVKDHQHKGAFIVFVDLFKRADLTDSDLGPDGEHPNDAGYEKLAEYWSWVLQRHEMSALKIPGDPKGIDTNDQL